MRCLVTGATGQLGRELVPLLLARGDDLLLLARDQEKSQRLFPHCPVLEGDVTRLIPDSTQPVDAVYHLAADVNLGRKHEQRTWNTNYTGTAHVLEFCLRNSVSHLYYVSTAYTFGRNQYEISKREAESLVERSFLMKTIFKPGVIIPCMDIIQPSMGTIYQFARVICTVHERAEVLRRAIEGTLRLPVIEPVFRVRGNQEGHINLVPVDRVARFIAEHQEEGTFWLTHPRPPTVGEVTGWIGEALYVDIRVEKDFQMSAVEALFHRMAEPFLPYLQGDDFPSDLDCPSVSREFIRQSVRHSVVEKEGN
ncbi:MAG: NAD-dependent epimerase/dehydratase family protein [Patescibacteria group bacterium]